MPIFSATYHDVRVSILSVIFRDVFVSIFSAIPHNRQPCHSTIGYSRTHPSPLLEQSNHNLACCTALPFMGPGVPSLAAFFHGYSGPISGCFSFFESIRHVFIRPSALLVQICSAVSHCVPVPLFSAISPASPCFCSCDVVANVASVLCSGLTSALVHSLDVALSGNCRRARMEFAKEPLACSQWLRSPWASSTGHAVGQFYRCSMSILFVLEGSQTTWGSGPSQMCCSLSS